MFRDRYEPLLRALARGELADLVADARIVHVSGGDLPWTDTGMELAAGERWSALSEGRLVLSEELDLWLPPHLYLWRRVGEKGPIFKAPRDTWTHLAATPGRLELAVNPGQWSTPAGDFLEAPEPFAGVPGGFDVLLLRWRHDPLEGLRALARHVPGDALIAAEIRRLESPRIETPRGWEYLWFLGEAEVFSEHAGSIQARTENDVAILKHPVRLPLTSDTRLRWRWRIERLPSKVAEHQVHTHDYLSIAVEFENGQDLTWLWSTELPTETSFRCPLPWWDQRETHLVVRSGPDELGAWVSEERCIADDYRAAIGQPPDEIVGVWLIAVSVFSHSVGVGEFADITVGDVRIAPPQP